MSARSESNTIYGTGMAIRAADLNNLRADIIDHEAEIANTSHGVRDKPIVPIEGSFTNCSYSEVSGYASAGGAPWSWDRTLNVISGERIVHLRVARFGTGSGSINISLRTVTSLGAKATVQTATVSNPPASWAPLLLTLTTPHTVVQGTQYYVRVDGTTIGQRFNVCELGYDRT